MYVTLNVTENDIRITVNTELYVEVMFVGHGVGIQKAHPQKVE